MLVNIKLIGANVILANVKCSAVNKFNVTFDLADNMKNATTYQLLDNVNAYIMHFACSGNVSAIVSRKHVEITFI